MPPKRKTAPVKKVEPDKAPPLSPRKLFFFRLLLFLLPFALVLMLELILRVTGYGYDPRLIVKRELDGKPVYTNNAKYTWTYFPRPLARGSMPFVLPAEKNQKTCRIFVLGASAAQGVPDPAFSFSRILEVMLEHAYPEARFEVINPAITAVNSHVVREMAHDCRRHDGDLYIIYVGNNEVVGPYGPGTVFAPLSENLTSIRLSIALRKTRLGQLMHNLVGAIDGKASKQTTWQGMEMFLEKQVRHDDPRLQTVYRHYRTNLEDTIDMLLKDDSQVILCSVGANLEDCAPFSSLHRPDLTEAQESRWDDLYQQALNLQKSGRFAEAINACEAAVAIDNHYADLHYLWANCALQMDNIEAARRHYELALEQDPLRFRPDRGIQQAIRNVAADESREGFTFVDVKQILEEADDNGIPGQELFWEHVHLTFKGNYLTAAALFERITPRLPIWIRQNQNKKPQPTALEHCRELLAYTPWDEYKLTEYVLEKFVQKPPFTNQLDNQAFVRRLENDLKQMETAMPEIGRRESAKIYRRALQRDPDDFYLHWRYAQLLEEMGDIQGATQHCRWLVNHSRDFAKGRDMLGQLLMSQQQYDEAKKHFKRALALTPYAAEIHYSLGVNYQFQGKMQQARQCYEQALGYNTGYVPAYINLGGLYFNEGELDKALALYRRGIKYGPHVVDFYHNQAIILEKKGRVREALALLAQGLKVDPDSEMIKRTLGILVKKYNLQKP